MYFWRSHAGLEIDLLIDRNGRLYPLEIKSTATPTPEHARAPRTWLALAAPREAKDISRGALLCNVAAPQPVDEGVRAAPWWWV
jgi:uncharacterized protein